MVRCPTQVDLERFLHGQVSAEERSEIETHHEGCETCRNWLEDARADEELVPNLVRAHAQRRAEPAADLTAGMLEAGTALSRYRILGRIGAGGMGVVFEAEQQNPRRRVALKVLRPAALSERALRRFEHETEALARLEHPGIAQIVEAGTFESHGDCVPFFAMELIEGRPLVPWAEDHALSVRERLELLLEVASAVQHAHQKGVLHLDLKPTNILVTAEGRPKVLDFGVARSFDPEGRDPEGSHPEGSSQARRSQVIEITGTLPYMSPEQLAGDLREVDTRADVYALGVLLFELLSGRLPYELGGLTVPEAIARVERAHPPRLGALVPDLPHDLEVIAGKALEKDKRRRYASAEALAEDIRRHLRHEPIEARPPSPGYLLGKFVRRNRAVVGGITLAFAALLVGVLATGVQARRALAAELDATEQARRARVAEGEARQQAQRAVLAEAEARSEALALEEVNAFLQTLIGFDPDDPMGATLGGETTLLEIARNAERRLDEAPLADAGSEAKVRIALGNFFARAGDSDRRMANLERALELRRATFGSASLEAATASNTLGAAYFAAGQLERAVERFQAALETYARIDEREHDPKVATTRFNLGLAYEHMGLLAAAEEAVRSALALHIESMGPDNLFVSSDWSALGGLLLKEKRIDEALTAFRSSLAAARAAGQEDHPRALSSRTSLGQALYLNGLYAEAEEGLERVLEVRIRTLGDDHLATAHTRHVLATVKRELGKAVEAEALARAAARVLREHPEKASDLGFVVGLLGGSLSSQGRYEEALPCFEEALRLQRRHRPGDPIVTSMQASIGHALVRLGDFEGAEPQLAQALARFARQPGHAQRSHEARAHLDHGAVAYERGRLEEAELRIRTGLELFEELGRDLGRDHGADLLGARLDLVLIRRDLGAEGVVEALEQLLADGLAAGVEAGESTAQVRLFLGSELRAAGDLSRAGDVLETALTQAAALEGAAGRALERRLDTALAGVRMDEGRFEEAEALLTFTAELELPVDEAAARQLLAQGRCLVGLERFAEAEGVLLDCLAGVEGFAAEGDALTRDVLEQVAALYEVWGLAASAAKYRERLR